MGVPRAQGASSQRESSHFVLSYKRLDHGLFARVDALTEEATYVELDDAAFEALLDGVVPVEPEPKKKRRARRRIH